jgi:hypothetical protein
MLSLWQTSGFFHRLSPVLTLCCICPYANFPKVGKTSDSYPFWPCLPGLNKASDLERYAELKGKDVRTVRAWCRSDKIPAYRKGKRWRINQEFLGRTIAREASLRYFRRYFGDGDGKYPLTARDKRALEYTLVKTDGLSDPEERRKYIFYRFKHHPDAYGETSQPYEDIMTAADWLMLKNGSVTIETLAKHLHMSKSNLYRRHPGMMIAIKKRYRTSDPRVVDLPGGVEVPGEEFDYDAVEEHLKAASNKARRGPP